MPYFREICDYKTYADNDADFHFSYNANTGGGQSFLGGRFRDKQGSLCPANVLNGRVAVFKFYHGKTEFVILDDNKTKYEIKPRAAGDSNMKLAVGRNIAPSKAIATFFMLPNTCGVKKTARHDTSVLCQDNFWLQSMWLDVDVSEGGTALLMPKDFVFCGGIGEDGGTLRCFSLDFSKRMADVLRLYANSANLENEVANCIKLFGDIYSGAAAFEYEKCAGAVQELMEFLKGKYPAEYSGVSDPLDFIVSHMVDQTLNGKKDTLTLALSVFKKERDNVAADIWPSFDEWAKDARQTFAAVDEHTIVDPAFDYSHFVRFVFSSRQRTAFSKFNNSQKEIVGKFLREERTSAHSVSWYIDPVNKVAVDGIGAGVMLYFMMMVQSDEFATWSGKMDEGLCILGLRKDDAPKDLTVANYEENKALQQIVMQKMHEMGIGKAADDSSSADYLTVNEFLWFVTAHEKDIKEELMKQQLKKPSGEKNPGTKKLKDVLSGKADDLMNRLVAALMTKPFAILAGASGTGKSRMAKKLAYMTCLDKDLQPSTDASGKRKGLENFIIIPVKPNWHDSSDLLGYRSSIKEKGYQTTPFINFIIKAHCFPETPFIACLDEMNLAPVEHYFAEYLSASEGSIEDAESGQSVSYPLIEPALFDNDVTNLQLDGYALPQETKELIERVGLVIPKNLFIVGTVNMDDTTDQISRKVLDRAMTIEMNEVNYTSLQNGNYEKLNLENLLLEESDIQKFAMRETYDPAKLDNDFRIKLDAIKAVLETSPFAVGYRFGIESTLYREALKKLPLKDESGADVQMEQYDKIAIDHMTLMKVLPRITGTLDERATLLAGLKDYFNANLEDKGLSKIALERMEKAARSNGGYLGFWP